MFVPQCFGLSSMCGDLRVLFMALSWPNSHKKRESRRLGVPGLGPGLQEGGSKSQSVCYLRHFCGQRAEKQHESRWLGVFLTLGAESAPSVKNTPCRRDSRVFLLFGHESAVNSTRIAFRDRFLVRSHQACGQSRSKTAPGSPVRGQASRFACFPAVWPRKKSPAYGRGSHLKRLIEVKPFQ